MSNLWIRAAAAQREAMAWDYDPKDPQRYTPVHVKDAGFAGVVGDHEDDQEMREQTGQAAQDEGFDEDLWDESAPDPTSHEQRHFEEHDEWPEAYEERRDAAYEQALERKREEAARSPYDHEDPELRHFVDHHAQNTRLWQDYGRMGKVNLRQPVYATQTHVAREHVEKYLANPNATVHHLLQYPHARRISDYLGHEHALFVTHQGRLHAIEGHHRIAAELQRGKGEMRGWHFNLDDHPQFGDGRVDDGDYPDD